MKKWILGGGGVGVLVISSDRVTVVHGRTTERDEIMSFHEKRPVYKGSEVTAQEEEEEARLWFSSRLFLQPSVPPGRLFFV